MRNKVINNRGSLKQIVIENSFNKFWSILTFHSLLPNLRERAGGIKKTYMCDNARRRIKIQIKKREKI